MKKTLIFDLDGTLLDTLADLHNGVNHALKKYGYIENSLEKTRKSIGNGLKLLIKRSLPDDTSEEAVDSVLQEMKQYYALHSHEKTKPYDGILELIAKLKQDGYQLAVVSNKADYILRDLVPYYFGEQIPVIIGESPELKRKPAPDMVFEALRRLDSAPEDAIYIGDSEVDLETAKNAGLPCLSVCWGFRSKELLMEHGAQILCSNCGQLYSVLSDWKMPE